ncbi:MAG: non-canonical purine NTP pyrophosphatase, RdgB/HAM1 family [Chloroflexi bacterium RBG_13_68_17]|jgi:XTP/dITP diphosphohydrolase|nr:MAG: non-canonical purine NTP pyrophosphatase, RdgB/HAM1 family [Chloroflexi bacterium RBG_13_68_17]
MQTLLVATNNPGKWQEMQDLLAGLPLALRSPADLGLALVVEEHGGDYPANARLKATAFAAASRQWTLADDTGLEVDALGGAPGVRSHRLLDDHAGRLPDAAGTDADRRRLLLMLLQPHPRPWTARFRCAVALASPDGALDLAEGICPGEILPQERGASGFGYDPIFLLQGSDRTMAELSLAEKNQRSHRARAVQALLPTLRARLGLPPAPP